MKMFEYLEKHGHEVAKFGRYENKTFYFVPTEKDADFDVVECIRAGKKDKNFQIIANAKYPIRTLNPDRIHRMSCEWVEG